MGQTQHCERGGRRRTARPTWPRQEALCAFHHDNKKISFCFFFKKSNPPQKKTPYGSNESSKSFDLYVRLERLGAHEMSLPSCSI